jgi:glycosyltransferase involved in cell wall biosynthesis
VSLQLRWQICSARGDSVIAPDRPHLLYVAWGFPPCRGGGVYRAFATANAFAAAGWRVTVITADREFFIEKTGADVALEAAVNPSVEIVRVPFSRPALDMDRARYSAFRRALPRVWWRWRKWADQLTFPEPGYGPWRARIEAAADGVHTADPVDLVLATANPSVAFTVALRLHRRHGVPYVMDYRDAWSLDVFSGTRVHGERSRVGRWERRLLTKAAEVWFVNEPIRDWHSANYPEAAERMHVVANGWDREPLPHQPRLQGDSLAFGYLGTISRQVPIEELLAGWRAARSKDARILNARLELRGYLGFYGSPDAQLDRALTQAVPFGVTFGGAVSKTEVGDLYSGWDILLLVLGTGRYVTSGKVFEYLATGLPVVSVHDPGNAASDVLRGYPRWFPAASLSATDIASAISAAAVAAMADGPAVSAAARAFAAQYQRDRQFAPRLIALAALVGDKAGR